MKVKTLVETKNLEGKNLACSSLIRGRENSCCNKETKASAFDRTIFTNLKLYWHDKKSAREIISMQPMLYYVVKYFCCLKQLN